MALLRTHVTLCKPLSELSCVSGAARPGPQRACIVFIGTRWLLLQDEPSFGHVYTMVESMGWEAQESWDVAAGVRS